MSIRFSTQVAITANTVRLGHEEFRADDVEGITFQTFKKYVPLERIERGVPTDISYKDYVTYVMTAEPNDDFWYFYKKYKPTTDGKVERVEVTYKIL